LTHTNAATLVTEKNSV